MQTKRKRQVMEKSQIIDLIIQLGYVLILIAEWKLIKDKKQRY